VIVVRDSDRVRDVLEPVYGAMDVRGIRDGGIEDNSAPQRATGGGSAARRFSR
jgi:hypothetical protein